MRARRPCAAGPRGGRRGRTSGAAAPGSISDRIGVQGAGAGQAGGHDVHGRCRAPPERRDQGSGDEPDQRQSRGAGTRAHGSAHRARTCRVSLPGAHRAGRPVLASRDLGRSGLLADRRHASVLRGRNAAGSMVLAGRSGLCVAAGGVPLERTRAPCRGLDRGPAIAGTDVRGTRRTPADRQVDARGPPRRRRASYPDLSQLGRPGLPGRGGGRARHRREPFHRAWGAAHARETGAHPAVGGGGASELLDGGVRAHRGRVRRPRDGG